MVLEPVGGVKPIGLNGATFAFVVGQPLELEIHKSDCSGAASRSIRSLEKPLRRVVRVFCAGASPKRLQFKLNALVKCYYNLFNTSI